ncbi:hypothetical protein G7Y89_g2821 [Cudoniella acicularis]|uniref:Uncharacterized protein n=1 Tax=Cudoniella acicularis TaxID=354080 RepID=A0A8H4RTE8_9HELO|nr:hypothetical protein G7Y89_g2821 [Cudoniella acicularis]
MHISLTDGKIRMRHVEMQRFVKQGLNIELASTSGTAVVLPDGRALPLLNTGTLYDWGLLLIDFEADSALAVGTEDASSYATKRVNFEADSSLAVGQDDVSSYATKRSKFEADPTLAVGTEDVSSYASKRANFEADSSLAVGKCWRLKKSRLLGRERFNPQLERNHKIASRTKINPAKIASALRCVLPLDFETVATAPLLDAEAPVFCEVTVGAVLVRDAPPETVTPEPIVV